MIVRILGQGQLAIDPAAKDELNALDAKVEAAVNASNEEAFRTAFCALLGRIRELGEPLDDAALEPSDLILPDEDATIEDVRKLLSDDGLIPG
jgi:hypothetical protein